MRETEYLRHRAELELLAKQAAEDVQALDRLWERHWKGQQPAPEVGAVVRRRSELPPIAALTAAPAQLTTWRERATAAVEALEGTFTSQDVCRWIEENAGRTLSDNDRATVTSTLAKLVDADVIEKVLTGTGGKPSEYRRHSPRSGASNREAG
jgi:hypothetical protein